MRFWANLCLFIFNPVMDVNHSSPHDVADVASWQSVAACPGGLWKIQLRRKHRQMLKSDCRDVEGGRPTIHLFPSLKHDFLYILQIN